MKLDEGDEAAHSSIIANAVIVQYNLCSAYFQTKQVRDTHISNIIDVISANSDSYNHDDSDGVVVSSE